tara:strand:- start:479 stop:823 length:345 start_codon:yes stop_codon:yes gene_type:complete
MFDPRGYTSNQRQGGKIMERFYIRGPLAERGEGTEELEDGLNYPGGKVPGSAEREAYCVRFNGKPSVYMTLLADELTPITAAVARKENKKLTGSAALPGADAPRPPARCGKGYT